MKELEEGSVIGKYHVTTAEWRDFDEQEVADCAEIEKLLKSSYPLSKSMPRKRIDMFCDYLSKRYRTQIPKGYVFRLPTDAEWEWAFAANGSIRDFDRKGLDPRHEENRESFRKKAKLAKDIRFDDVGMTHYGALQGEIFVGGRLSHSTFGVCDMIVPRGVIVFDEYAAFANSDSGLRPDHYRTERYFVYDDEEIDPVHWDGLMNFCNVTRVFGSRSFYDRHGSLAHIVIAPDLGVKERVRNEEANPYPHSAFGGELLSDRIKVTDISSRFHDEGRGYNTPERWALVVSDEPVIVPQLKERKDLRGCHTGTEESPWVQLSLESATAIAGIQIDVFTTHFRGPQWTEHLRIWTSEDGKNWREIAKDEAIRCRYKFDLRGRNIKAKHIRVGRERGFKKDSFSVNKILVYGKK